MRALTFDRARENWDSSTGMVLEDVPEPTLDPSGEPHDVLVRVRFAGFCGSDRSLWSRRSFRGLVLGSLDEEGATRRVFGHELFGEVVAVGDAVTRVAVGDTVSAESHVYCGVCPRCLAGEHHVCENETILGISRDGVFADLVKVPERILWPTDVSVIRPEVAAVQEPFGNAVHACQAAPMEGSRVLILGTGTIGLFAVLVARGLGATQVVGVDIDPERRALAEKLGADVTLAPGRGNPDRPWASDPELLGRLDALTDGHGFDVAMEMSGHPASLNHAVHAARPGGHVVLFGVHDGDAIVEAAHHIVMRGLTLRGVVGRRVFGTWEITRRLLSDPSLGIQDAIWEHVLQRGEGPVVDMDHWTREGFEAVMNRHPKPVLRFG